MNIWTPVLFAVQFALIFIEIIGAKAFGFVIIIFSFAGIAVSAGMSNVPNVSYFVNVAGWSLGWAQLVFGLIIVLFGRKALSGGGGR